MNLDDFRLSLLLMLGARKIISPGDAIIANEVAGTPFAEVSPVLRAANLTFGNWELLQPVK
jgi:hypothetical protein